MGQTSNRGMGATEARRGGESCSGWNRAESVGRNVHRWQEIAVGGLLPHQR